MRAFFVVPYNSIMKSFQTVSFHRSSSGWFSWIRDVGSPLTFDCFTVVVDFVGVNLFKDSVDSVLHDAGISFRLVFIPLYNIVKSGWSSEPVHAVLT